jgi:hypothetical protein
MDNRHKRILLFLFFCIGTRALFTYVVAKHEKKYRLGVTILLLIPAIGFGYIYANDLRKTGREVFGDKIWWNYMRPFHSLMYFLTAYLVNLGHEKAFYPLALDTIAGLRAFTLYHTSAL